MALDAWLENKRDDLAQSLGFTNAVPLRHLGQLLRMRTSPATPKQGIAFDYFLAEAGLTALYHPGSW